MTADHFMSSPRPHSRLRRASTLLSLARHYALGTQQRRYDKGEWLRELSGYPGIPDTVEAFQQERYRLTRAFKSAHYRMPVLWSEAEALWAEPDARCHLFAFLGRRERHPLRWLRWMRWLPWWGRICEFGAGAAPLAHGLTRAWPFPRPHVDVSDIPWPLLDYCRWRFFYEPRVTVRQAPHTLNPLGTWGLYDAVLCTETLEHLPDPLYWAQNIILPIVKPGGRLLFDYGVQATDQPYAPRGQSRREETIRWLLEQGTVLNGGTGEGLTVLQKDR